MKTVLEAPKKVEGYATDEPYSCGYSEGWNDAINDFEAWNRQNSERFAHQYPNDFELNLENYKVGIYEDYQTQMAWLAYQAAAKQSIAKLGGDVSIYLKDGETVVQRLERERLDVITTLDMLAKERGIVEKHTAKIAQMQARIDELVELLTDARDDVNECLNTNMPNAGWERYDTRIKFKQEQLAKIDEALEKVKDVK